MLPVGPNIRFVSVGSRRIAYRATGDAGGAPMVLLHGLASDFSSWDLFSQHLTHAGFRVIVFDLPGHGRSDWAAPYSLASMEDALATALDHLNLGRFDLVGHSLGAHLALRLAARSPGRVRRLVAESAPVPPRDAEEAWTIARARVKPSLWRLIKLLGIGRLARIALLRRFDFKAAKPLIGELRGPMPQWWESLARIRNRCLLITGSNDGLVTSRADLILAGMRDATLQVLGTGHHLHRSHPDAFLDAVLPFLNAPEVAHQSQCEVEL
jgi:pimeloyl-ACP methyl ester carboxylesterase